MILQKDINAILNRQPIIISRGTILNQIMAIIMLCISISALYFIFSGENIKLDAISYFALAIFVAIIFFSIKAIRCLTSATIQYDRIVGKTLLGTIDVPFDNIVDYDTFRFKRKTYLIVTYIDNDKSKKLWISPKVYADWVYSILGKDSSDAYDILFYAIEYKNKDLTTFKSIISSLVSDEINSVAA